jgi:tRNA-dihydrouridine synthase A
VQSGTFGAVLMTRPDLVAECVAAMIGAVNIPVTVKCRIGVDDQTPEDILPAFLDRIRSAGVRRVSIHARKAWLQGLSPKQNRDIPPLDYDLVHQMKAEFPDLHVSLNGGVTSLDQALSHLDRGLDGIMIGRAAYSSPWDILGDADSRVFGMSPRFSTPHQVVHAMRPYIEAHLAEGGRLHSITRHMLGLFTGRPGTRHWRRHLSENANKDGAGFEIVEQALDFVTEPAALGA